MSGTHPKPWAAHEAPKTAHYRWTVFDATGAAVAIGMNDADARMIVAAVNSHADLLAACEAAVEAIEQNIDDEDTDDGAPTWAQALHMQLQAAITKARGTT